MMQPDWELLETNTHQDHVIAHVVGATVLGYFAAAETACMVLDIGFVWTIYLDGEMGLVPQTMAIAELEIDDETRSQLRADLDVLSGAPSNDTLHITQASGPCLITEVQLFSRTDQRRLVVSCEDSEIAIETSLATGEIRFNTPLT